MWHDRSANTGGNNKDTKRRKKMSLPMIIWIVASWVIAIALEIGSEINTINNRKKEGK